MMSNRILFYDHKWRLILMNSIFFNYNWNFIEHYSGQQRRYHHEYSPIWGPKLLSPTNRRGKASSTRHRRAAQVKTSSVSKLFCVLRYYAGTLCYDILFDIIKTDAIFDSIKIRCYSTSLKWDANWHHKMRCHLSS